MVISPYLLVSGVTQYSLYRCAMAWGITIGTSTELTTSVPAYPAREIFFSTMVLQIYYVTSCVPTLSFVLRSQFLT